MSLNIHAEPFKPSFETVAATHPHSPNATSGFVMLDTDLLPHVELDDAELWEGLSSQDVAELEDVNAWNTTLATFEWEEERQELLSSQLMTI